MFTNPDRRLPEPQREALVRNPQKMVCMVDGVASFLADVLQITDKEVAGKAALVEVSRQEIHHLLRMLSIAKTMGRLGKTYEFVVEAEDLAERMRDCALRCQGENMDICVFTPERAYYCDDVVTKTIGATTTTVNVGALGERIMSDIAESARAWYAR